MSPKADWEGQPPEPTPGAGKVQILVVVEDDPDVQLLIETVFSMDPRFSVGAVATAVEDALALADPKDTGIIILDHGLSGVLTGLEAAPQLKAKSPLVKIILFTARAELREQAEVEVAIDAFVLKTESGRLLPVALELSGFGAATS